MTDDSAAKPRPALWRRAVTCWPCMACAAECGATALILLGLRIWIGLQFLASGRAKVGDFSSAPVPGKDITEFQQAWANTKALFQYEFNVPLLPPGIAAFCGTAIELCAPILLFLGFGTRFAALPLLAMAMVIQFWMGWHLGQKAYLRDEHLVWMLVLLVLIARGGGLLSLDHLIARKLRKTATSDGCVAR